MEISLSIFEFVKDKIVATNIDNHAIYVIDRAT